MSHAGGRSRTHATRRRGEEFCRTLNAWMAGRMVLSAVDGGEGRAELRRYARLIQPAALMTTSWQASSISRGWKQRSYPHPQIQFSLAQALRTGTELSGGHLVGNGAWTRSFIVGRRPR